ncbi:hypothetical protein BBD41_04195 [Paenibacillus ihbetae]|uniref:Uncharacterized protein n=2 Tax=Paenibacillus ihbetae TaxID=1870820 RepID=A0A1B2DVW0_9BACL|nr:hypothetical protein BBD41_04195 [Paenibacillus ihbetae]OOC60847.1 hypothetical protein BBD40_02475 [Paenibacillus ihbetae]
MTGQRERETGEVHDSMGQAMEALAGRLLLRVLIGLAAAMVIIQLLLHYEPARPYISPVQQMEGVPVNEQNVNDWMGGNTPSLLHHSS